MLRPVPKTTDQLTVRAVATIATEVDIVAEDAALTVGEVMIAVVRVAKDTIETSPDHKEATIAEEASKGIRAC